MAFSREMSGNTRALFLTGILLVAWNSVFACQVPVFRFALERWTSDPYNIHLIPADSSGEVSGEERQALERLEKATKDPDLPSNTVVDVPAAVENATPGLHVHYPRKFPGVPPRRIWTGPATMANAGKILESPARRELIRRILSGDSVVWLFLRSGDEEADRAVRKTLDATIARAKELFKIPEGVVTENQVEDGDFSGDLDDIVKAGVPLKVDFSVLEISRDDPEESVFLTMLLHLEEDLHEFSDAPMVFPVFGRCRVLEPLIGKGINADMILNYADYLCGACSCEVKDQNPGMDLLVAANWDAAIEGNTAVIEKILPPLEGTGILTSLEHPETPKQATVEVPDEKHLSPYLILAGVLGLTLLGLGIASRILLRRSSP